MSPPSTPPSRLVSPQLAPDSQATKKASMSDPSTPPSRLKSAAHGGQMAVPTSPLTAISLMAHQPLTPSLKRMRAVVAPEGLFRATVTISSTAVALLPEFQLMTGDQAPLVLVAVDAV